MSDELRRYGAQLEALAQSQGLNYWPVDFELVPSSFMTEVAVYGLPVRMPHWSFGVRYIYQLVQHRMGHSRLFEVVFPGNPGRAYLANNNSLEENVLVTAHVLGHADFARNNLLFRNSQEQVGYHIVEQAAAHAHRIAQAIDEHGLDRVEPVLDAALALEQHVDLDQPLQRPPYTWDTAPDPVAFDPAFQRRYLDLAGTAPARPEPRAAPGRRPPLPPQPEYDLLWFIANYAPDLEDWERDIFLAVREESFYFYPVFACQIMNEGWASYWHARLLRDAGFLPQRIYVEAIKAHSDVVRPYAGDEQVALQVNPYHLGFSMWEEIVERQGLDQARRIMMADDDFSFVRNYLSEDLAAKLQLFRYAADSSGHIKVQERDLDALRETLIANKFNFGAPRISADAVQSDGTLVLRHDHRSDGRGLDLARARKVLGYVHSLWRRPVVLHTVNDREQEAIVTAGAADGRVV